MSSSGFVGRQQPVDLAACLVEKLRGTHALGIAARGRHLLHSHEEMMDGMTKVRGTFSSVGRSFVPRRCLGGGELLGSLSPGVSQARHLLAILIARRDQALVVEQL